MPTTVSSAQANLLLTQWKGALRQHCNITHTEMPRLMISVDGETKSLWIGNHQVLASVTGKKAAEFQLYKRAYEVLAGLTQ